MANKKKIVVFNPMDFLKSSNEIEENDKYKDYSKYDETIELSKKLEELIEYMKEYDEKVAAKK